MESWGLSEQLGKSEKKDFQLGWSPILRHGHIGTPWTLEVLWINTILTDTYVNIIYIYIYTLHTYIIFVHIYIYIYILF